MGENEFLGRTGEKGAVLIMNKLGLICKCVTARVWQFMSQHCSIML